MGKKTSRFVLSQFPPLKRTAIILSEPLCKVSLGMDALMLGIVENFLLFHFVVNATRPQSNKTDFDFRDIFFIEWKQFRSNWKIQLL